MTPLQQALALALAVGISPAEFYRMADLAMVDGVFYCGPDALLIAFDEGDTWFLWFATGDVGKMFALAPEPKRYISYQRTLRGQTARITVGWDRVKQLIKSHGWRKPKQESGLGVVGAPAGHDPERGQPVD